MVAVLTLRAFGVPIALGPEATPSPSPTRTPAPSGAASPDLADALAQLEGDVADIRDLPPADIGPAEFVTREELEQRLADQFAEDYPPEDVAADNALYQALGLLDPSQDIAELQLQLLSGQVLGYYDDVTRSMVIVTDAGFTAEAQVTYAHEYTHALQDAAFGIDSMQLDADGDDDGAFARLGLVEGDASTAMVLWAIDNLTVEDMVDISQTPLPDTTGVPAWMVRQLEFPYADGAEFVAQLYANGGFAAVDEAWADPPRSTEQVLHFAAYLEDEPPVEVVEVDPDIRALGVDVVGEHDPRGGDDRDLARGARRRRVRCHPGGRRVGRRPHHDAGHSRRRGGRDPPHGVGHRGRRRPVRRRLRRRRSSACRSSAAWSG